MTTSAPPRLLLEHDRAAIFHGDSALLDLPECSVDAIVCDPPSSIGFMSREWDDNRGGFDGWTTWLARVLVPSVRALRPGGHALFWGLPRTVHLTMRAVELAGLEIRDVHHDIVSADEIWQDLFGMLDERQAVALARALETAGAPGPLVYQAYGVGFPKASDIARDIDMHLCTLPGRHYDKNLPQPAKRQPDDHLCPAHPLRAKGEGLFSALKPAVEPWVLARKPLGDMTYAECTLAHGTSGLNIDACRIGNETAGWGGGGRGAADQGTFNASTYGLGAGAPRPQVGRWPAHLSLRHAPGCVLTGTTTEQVSTYENVGEKDRDDNSTNFAMGKQTAGAAATIAREVYRCAPGCPVAELDAQSGALASGKRKAGARKGIGYKANAAGDGGPAIVASAGGASRFFLTTPPFCYVAKPSRREKDAGLAHLKTTSGGEATDREDGSAGLQSPRAGAGRNGGAKNPHPTVKGISLMEWLIRLVVPDPKTLGRPGVVLDPFAGSGSTGVAALGLGHDFIGAELTDDYIPALLGRIRHALDLPPDDESK